MTLQYYLHLGEKLTKAQHKPRLLAIRLTAVCYNYFRHVHSITLGGRVLNMNEQKVSITGLKKTKNKISGSDVLRETECARRAAVKSCCSNVHQSEIFNSGTIMQVHEGLPCDHLSTA